MLAAEEVEAEVAEVVKMGGIGESVRGRKMRNPDTHDRSPASDSMDFSHHRDHIVHMLDQMEGEHQFETIIGERPRYLIEIMDYVGAHVAAQVNVDGLGNIVAAAAKVEDYFLRAHFLTSGNFRKIGDRPDEASVKAGFASADVHHNPALGKDASTVQARTHRADPLRIIRRLL